MGMLDHDIYNMFRRGVMPKQAMQIGSFSSSTIGKGVVLKRSGQTAAYRVYADDGDAVLYGSGSVPDIRGSLSRVLLTKNNTGGNIRIWGTMGQLKAYDSYWNGEQVGAVHGRLELVRSSATMILGGYGVSAAGAFTVATSGAMTVNTNHILAGVASVSDFRATLTQTGKTAAFLAYAYDTDNWSDGTARTKWGYAFYAPAKSASCGLLLGDFSSATAGSGFALSATNTAAARIYADDGGAKLAAGEKRVGIARFLYATEDTDATDQTMSGFVGQVKVANNLTINGNLAGLCGYLEVAAAKTLIGGRAAQGSIASAVWGRVDVPATGVIGSDAFVSAFGAGANLGGTHTGKATVLHVVNPSAGAWDYFAVLGSATGCNTEAYTGNGAFVPNNKGTFTQVGQLKINIGGNDYYIPYGTVA